MTSGIRGDEFDDLFTRTRQALDQVRAATGAQPAEPPEPVTGTAADGKVRASFGPDGLLAELAVEPVVLREGLEQLCAHVVSAVNAAIGELRARSGPLASVDTAALADTLRDVQEDSLRRMATFGQSIDEVIARLSREAR